MPVTDAFLATCRAAITSLPELAAFRAALASVGVGSRDQRAANWVACYDNSQSSTQSPAYQVRKAIRETVRAQADANGTLSPLDRESAYRTMVLEFVPQSPQPMSLLRESEELQRLKLANDLSGSAS